MPASRPSAQMLAEVDRLYAACPAAPLEDPPPLTQEEEGMINDLVFVLRRAGDRMRTMSVMRAMLPLLVVIAFPCLEKGERYDQP